MSWTRGTTAANNGSVGSFCFTPELQVTEFLLGGFWVFSSDQNKVLASAGFFQSWCRAVMCSSLAVFHVAQGASDLHFIPQPLGSFFLGSLHQSCPSQSSVRCPCPAKHTAGCRDTDCARMWPWVLLSPPSNPVFLKASSEHPACESCWEGKGFAGCPRSGRLWQNFTQLLPSSWARAGTWRAQAEPLSTGTLCLGVTGSATCPHPPQRPLPLHEGSPQLSHNAA